MKKEVAFSCPGDQEEAKRHISVSHGGSDINYRILTDKQPATFTTANSYIRIQTCTFKHSEKLNK